MGRRRSILTRPPPGRIRRYILRPARLDGGENDSTARRTRHVWREPDDEGMHSVNPYRRPFMIGDVRLR